MDDDICSGPVPTNISTCIGREEIGKSDPVTRKDQSIMATELNSLMVRLVDDLVTGSGLY